MSLRRRLVIGILALLVIAVAVTDVVTYSSLHSYLFGRVDEQIDVAQSQAYRYIDSTYLADVRAGDPLGTPAELQAWLGNLGVTGSCLSPSSGFAPRRPSGLSALAGRGRQLSPELLTRVIDPDVYVEILDSSGQAVFCDPSGSASKPDPAPRLPLHLPVQAHPSVHQFGGTHGPFIPDRPSFDVGSVTGATSYRVQAIAMPGGTLVTALPLAPTSATLTSLVRVELLVSVVICLAAVVIALLVVRVGLRPLDDMTDTAGAIAAGDLTRRVRDADARTEVGRLGRALNGMLSQIEAAFGQRTASEARLRRFVADASHELRTPLTSIRGYAELLRKGALQDDADRVRAAERIEHEAARMGLLVDDLLLLARLDQGRPLELSRVDLGRLVSRAVEDARTAYRDHPIDVDVLPGAIVHGDSSRLRQIVDNLLSNAVVHTPPGTTVHVRVRPEAERALLVVADEGPGLVPEQAARVFDRFYRGSTVRTAEGAGLGLSIVWALAAAHGGTADVSSEPGNGAIFTVSLPLSEPHPGDAGASGGNAGAAPGASPPMKAPSGHGPVPGPISTRS